MPSLIRTRMALLWGTRNSKISLRRIKAREYRNRGIFKLLVMFHYVKLNLAFRAIPWSGQRSGLKRCLTFSSKGSVLTGTMVPVYKSLWKFTAKVEFSGELRGRLNRIVHLLEYLPQLPPKKPLKTYLPWLLPLMTVISTWCSTSGYRISLNWWRWLSRQCLLKFA